MNYLYKYLTKNLYTTYLYLEILVYENADCDKILS